MNDNVRRIADHWDAAAKRTLATRRRNWRDFPFILNWLHKRICGEEIKGPGNAGLMRVFKERLNGRVLGRGISIGCGSGLREVQLVKGGFVKEMVGYDLSPDRIAMAENFARKYGVADRAKFHCEDGMKRSAEKFDLAFWHGSLHHMYDTAAAVEWSWNALNPGGYFWALEYTTPARRKPFTLTRCCSSRR